MFDQDPREKLLHDVAGIRVGIPYSATIKNEETELSGQVIFAIADQVTFKFFQDERTYGTHVFSPFTSAVLHIESLGICWNVACSGIHPPEMPTKLPIVTITWRLQDDWLGSEVDGLTSLTVGYSGIPTGWRGNADVPYYEGYNRERLGWSMMAGIQLDFTGWSVHLQSVPEHRVLNGVRHIATIERTQSFSSCEAEQFISDLHYFLCFLFGGNPGMVFAEGRKEYKLSWGSLHGRVSQPPERLATWYGKMRSPHDLSGIFTAFCEMEAEDKAIMSNMITHYTTSEELVLRTKPAAILHAIVASYSALEGLVRWISEQESDMPDRDKCFYPTRSGSWRIRDKRFARAVARVCEHLKLNDPRDHQALREQARTLNDYRNDIAHASDMHGSEGTQLYNVWNKSQCLVEALILRKLGFVGVIPNRTALPVYNVRGEDVLKKRRRGRRALARCSYSPT